VIISYSAVNNVELIESIIKYLKKGKAHGTDNLMAEHLKLGHPLVLCTITMLFKLMIKLNFVPNAFGLGITIPIPKGDKNHVFNKLEDFRGIVAFFRLKHLVIHAIIL